VQGNWALWGFGRRGEQAWQRQGLRESARRLPGRAPQTELPRATLRVPSRPHTNAPSPPAKRAHPRGALLSRNRRSQRRSSMRLTRFSSDMGSSSPSTSGSLGVPEPEKSERVIRCDRRPSGPKKRPAIHRSKLYQVAAEHIFMKMWRVQSLSRGWRMESAESRVGTLHLRLITPTLDSSPPTLDSSPSTSHPQLSTPNPRLFTRHPRLCTLDPRPCTLHPRLCTPHRRVCPPFRRQCCPGM